jgi:hypothetical protein
MPRQAPNCLPALLPECWQVVFEIEIVRKAGTDPHVRTLDVAEIGASAFTRQVGTHFRNSIQRGRSRTVEAPYWSPILQLLFAPTIASCRKRYTARH